MHRNDVIGRGQPNDLTGERERETGSISFYFRLIASGSSLWKNCVPLADTRA